MKTLLALALLLLPGALPAAVYSLTATDSGFINAEGRSSKNDGVVIGAAPATFNYSVGFIDEVAPLSGSDVARKNYFTFDLSSIPVGETILSATLFLFNPLGGYGSPDPTETFVISGTGTGPAGMAALAADLESVYSIIVPPALAHVEGDLYPALASIGFMGSKVVSAADDGTMVTIPLAAPGLGYLSGFQGLGPVVLSGFLATPDGIDAGDEFMFGFSKPLITGVVSPDPSFADPTPIPVLMITTVPEPAPWALLAGALALLFMVRRGINR